MRRIKNSVFYISIISLFSLIMYWTIFVGTRLEKNSGISNQVQETSNNNVFFNSITDNFHHPLFILLLQIITIIFVSRILSALCKKIGQPAVIGEIIAGILLGPSLFGGYFPEISQKLFPVSSLNNLNILSQIGLIFFMFMVGMELDLTTLRKKINNAVVISGVSIIIPFSLGMILAYFLYSKFAPEHIKFASFGLFLGIAMSITAFPVLARIVYERNIHKTPIGAVVITSAAVDDISAWCLLATVIAIVKGGSVLSTIYIILIALLYVGIMLKVVRPFLRRIGELYPSRQNLSKPVVAIFFITLLISSATTELIGIHALFGAFMAGVIMPENMRFRNILIEKIEDVALVLFLPLFFVYTGLRTEIGLINSPSLWLVTLIISIVAVSGKLIGGAIASRFVGQSWKDSLTIGVLMNTRGLMELVVLNIGYDLGVLNAEIFSMMVIMALVTTFMTGPSLTFIDWIYKKRALASPNTEIKDYFKILISFAHPEKGRDLLKLANFFSRSDKEHEITVLHLAPDNKVHQINIEEYEREVFAPVLKESKQMNQKISTVFNVSRDIPMDIIKLANNGVYDLVLVGVGHSIYEGSLLGRVLGFTNTIMNQGINFNSAKGTKNIKKLLFEEKTNLLLAKCHLPVGIFIGKKITKLEKVIIPLISNKDIQFNDFVLNIFYPKTIWTFYLLTH